MKYHALCRWDKNYSACYLDDMPHKRLTRPVRVFEWFFDGVRKGHGRENILRLEVSGLRCAYAACRTTPLTCLPSSPGNRWHLHGTHMKHVLMGLRLDLSYR